MFNVSKISKRGEIRKAIEELMNTMVDCKDAMDDGSQVFTAGTGSTPFHLFYQALLDACKFGAKIKSFQDAMKQLKKELKTVQVELIIAARQSFQIACAGRRHGQSIKACG